MLALDTAINDESTAITAEPQEHAT